MRRLVMKVGNVRTSLKLEDEFWDYLRMVAAQKGIRLSALVNQVAATDPTRNNMASLFRVFALTHATLAAQAMAHDLERIRLGADTEHLASLAAIPTPVLLLDKGGRIEFHNTAFSRWLGTEDRGIDGRNIDHLLIVRAVNGHATLARVMAGGAPHGEALIKYISPSGCRSAKAAIARRTAGSDPRGALLVFSSA